MFRLALHVQGPAQRLDTIGMFPDQDRTPDEINAYIKTEIAKWAKVIKDADVKPAD